MNRFSTLLACTLAFAATTANALEIKQMITVAEATESFANVNNVKVEGRFCKVNILSALNDSVLITGKLEAMTEHDAYRVVIDRSDAAVNVSVVVPDDAFSSFVGELTIALPEKVAVEVQNTSGYISVNGLKNNNLKLFTGQGKVTVADFVGNLLVETKNGSVTAERIEGEINTSSLRGDLTFSNLKGNLTFDTPDGAVTLTHAVGNVSGKTVAGLQTYSDIDGTLDIQGSSGAIKVSNAKGVFNIKSLSASVNFFETRGEFHIETTKGQIVGQKGVSLTASSDFTTTEGKINIRLGNSLDELTFDLACESSKSALIAKKTSKKKKLKLGKGAIIVTGRTKTGAQVFG